MQNNSKTRSLVSCFSVSSVSRLTKSHPYVFSSNFDRKKSQTQTSLGKFLHTRGFGKLIYDNYIFDIPRLFDICSLYSSNNKDLLTKMIGNIFKQQPGYRKDLQHALQSIKEVINNRIKVFHTQTGPKKLSSTTSKSPAGDVQDLLYYILDLSCTINRFLSVYPEGNSILFGEHFHLTQVRDEESANLTRKDFYLNRLIDLYETFLRAFERVDQENEYFEETKYEVINLFNGLFTSCCINQLINDE